MNWWNIIQYIGAAFILYICGSLIYLWLSYNGSVGSKIWLLVLIGLLILVLTSDFHEEIINFFKKFFNGLG